MAQFKWFSFVVVLLVGQITFAGDLFDREEYSSGFRPASHCDELMMSVAQRLTTPLKAFKDLSLANKIETVHILTHKPAPLNNDQLRSFGKYLHVLSETSMRKLEAHTDELLVIGIGLGAYLEGPVPAEAIPGFIAVLEEITALPHDGSQHQLMVFAGVQANLAHARIIQMRVATGHQKGLLLDQAKRDTDLTMRLGAEAGGYVGMKWLNLNLMLLATTIQQYDSFGENLKPNVRAWISAVSMPAFYQPEEMFLKLGNPLPKSTADLIFAIYDMPETKRFPDVYSRAVGFFELLKRLSRNKTN